jgi:uncharacterized protein YjbJ (UPF0337 family)
MAGRQSSARELRLSLTVPPNPRNVSMINEQVFKGNWTEIRGRVKEKWGSLTDDDLVLAEGKLDQLVGIIERRTGESRERIEHVLDQITGDYASHMDQIRRQAADVADGAREYAEQATEAARRQYEQLQRQFQEQYGHLSQNVQAGYSQAEACVRRNPVESICVAFGAGLLAGVIAGLAFRPSKS